MKVTVDINQLVAGLKAVTPYVGSKSYPGICGVQFEVVEGSLYTVAANFEMVATYRVDLEDGDGESDRFMAYLQLPQVQTVTGWLGVTQESARRQRIVAGPDVEVELSVAGNTDDRLQLSCRRGQSRLEVNTGAIFGTKEWRQLLQKAYRQKGKVALRAYPPRVLANLLKATSAGVEAPVVIWPAEADKPALVAVGERFVGALRPLKMADASDKPGDPYVVPRLPGWIQFPETPADAA